MKIKLLALFLLCFTTSIADAQRSFGNGKSSTPSTSSSSRPSTTSSSRPTTPSVSRPSTPAVKATPSTPSPTKSYGSGSTTKAIPPSPPVLKPLDIGTKPKVNNYDKNAAREQHKAESKTIFENAKNKTNNTPNTNTFYSVKKPSVAQNKPKDYKDQQTHDLRRQLDTERYNNRVLREREFYTGYIGRPVVHYHDPYSSFFWFWLLDRSINDQAMWAYHHRYTMSDDRYRDLLAKNSELAHQIHELELKNIERNPSFSPIGLQDQDLMYNKEHVDEVYNSSNSSFLSYFCWTVFIIGIVGFLIWLIFIKEFGNSK